MKKTPLIVLVVLLLVFSARQACAQSTSSKGTEFWTAFMDHSSAAGTNGSQMVLYITSDKATTGTVAFTDGTASIPYTVTANAVTFVPIPASQFLSTEGQFKKGIHITSVLPVAVYAHIYASSVSGATLLLPVNTMGKDYYSLNYTQLSNTNPSYSDFAVIATEDNTTVEITPTATLQSGKPAGTPFQIVLNKGELYQGLSSSDLTGTHIRSISTTSGICKKIAVFSGSSKIGIGTYNTALGTSSQTQLSSDNLFQQVYPTATWGKNFITVSLKSRNYDIYRIVLSKAATTVTLNGTIIPASSFTNSLYYEFTTTGIATNVISADQPIQVVQYTPTQSQAIPHPKTISETVGDPEMIYLSPIEQGLDHVTLYSTGYFAIQNAFINVVIPTSAVSTFTIDGVSGTVFTPISGTNYSFAQITTTHGPSAPNANPSYGGTATSGTHNLKASQPFNAIAYGFGQAESYGYAAGTNLVNLNEFVTLQDQSNSAAPSASSGCTNVLYKLQLSIPYQTTKITWTFKDGTTAPVVDNAPVVKSTTVKNGQTLYTYQYSGTVNYTAPGDYTVVATVFNPFIAGDDCGSNEDIEFDFSIADVPTATFTTANSCLGTATAFTDKSDPKTSTIKSWYWDFGDGQTAVTQNPTHTYSGAGDYPVTLTVTNENGCSTTSAPQTVHISALPQAGFKFTKPDCATQAITFTDASTTTEGTITTWLWDFGDGTPKVTKTDNNPFVHNFTTAGTYTVTLTVTTQAGCVSIPYNINVVVAPVPVVDFGLPSVCLQNSIAQFTDKTTITGTKGTPFSYLWDFGDVNATMANPGTAATANPTHLFTAAGVYHISLTVISNDGCSVTTKKDYTVTGKASFKAPAMACPADSVAFTDQTDPSNTAATAWHWDFGDATTADIQNPKHQFAKPGDYTVTLTVTGNNGCSTTNFSQAIHINKAPVAGFKYSAPDCAGGAVTFSDLSTAAEGTITSWIWDFGDGTPVQTNTTAAAFTHTFTTANTYTVKLLVTTDKGCTSVAATQSIIINPLPIVDFTLPTVCLQGSTAQFTDKTTVANTTGIPFKYLWNFGDANATGANPNTSTIANPTHLFNAAGIYHISLAVVTNDGCTFTTTKDYTVSGKANFTAVAVACPADVVTFTDRTDATKTVATAWHWDFGDGSIADVQNPQHAFAKSGNYTVTLTVTGNNGCSTTSFSQATHITASPVANFSYSTPDCETRAITFTDASTSEESPIASWIWDFGDGNTQTNTSATAFTHTFASANTYTVKLQVVTASGCASAVKTQTVIINPLPVVDFTLPGACLYDSPQFTNTSTIADGTEGSFTYLWNFGDPNASGTNANTSTIANPIHHYSVARDDSNPYIVSLTVTSKYGCTVSTTHNFTVNGANPVAAFSLDPSNTYCSSDAVTVINQSTVSFGKLTQIKVYWDYNNDQSNFTLYPQSQATTGTKYTHNYGLFNIPGQTKNFAVKVVAYSGSSTSCYTESTIQSITIKSNPVVTLSTIGTICQEASPVQITENKNGFTGTGTFTGTGISSTGLFDPAKAGPGIYTINYIFTAANSCGYSTSQQVTVTPTPKANAGPNLFLLEGGSIAINATASGTAPLTYKWTLPGGGKAVGLDRNDILTPTASPTSNTTYLLTVTSADGCTASSMMTVNVLKSPIIPSVFTPNGDGVNDRWNIQDLDTYPNATVEVFNRNGTKLYTSIGYPIPWDGTYNGALLPVGTYFYIIDPKNGRKVIAGSVTIIR